MCEIDLLAEVNLAHHDGELGDLNRLGEAREHLKRQLVELVDLDSAVLEAGPRPDK